MPQNNNIREISNNKIFQGVSSSVFKALNGKNFIGVKEGEIIFQARDESQSLFLIVEGEVKVKFSASRYSEVITKKKNEFFGEKEILEKSPRISSAVANIDSILFVISSKDLKKIISIDKQLKENLFKSGSGDVDVPDEYSGDVALINKHDDDNDYPNRMNEEDLPDAGPPNEEDQIKKREELKKYIPTEKSRPEPFVFAKEISEPEEELKENAELKEEEINFDEIGDDLSQKYIAEPEEELKKEEEINFDEIGDDLSQKYITEPEEEIKSLEDELEKNLNHPLHHDILEGVEPEDNLSWDFENTDFSDEDDEPIDYSNTIPTPIEIPDDLQDEFSSGSEPSSAEESISHLTVEQLKLIIEAAQKVNSELQIDKVLTSIVDAACSLTGADRGTLYIVDKENNQLWSKALSGGQSKEIRLQIGEGIAGTVAQNNEIVNLNDVRNDTRFNAEFDKATGYTTKNMLCFPINNKQGEVAAVLQLLNSAKGEFLKLDEDFLSAISVNAALALENSSLVEKLLHNDRMSSLGKMASFLIQDIKRPILTIKHYAEHIKKKNVPNDVKQVLDMLTEQANTVISLVTSTLSYSEGKALMQTQAVMLSDAMDDILSLLAEYVESRSVKLFKKFEADAVVNLGPKEFYQACFQITKNACDSMPGGGNVYITVLQDVDGQIKIDFKDQGLGIPSSLIDRIFDPFMSHGKKNGTGLGLSIAEKIVKDHSGYITVESDLGEGAVITIHLPVAVTAVK